jgi:serine protease Do
VLDRGAWTDSNRPFFVSSQHVLTNMHVIKGCSETWVKYPEYMAGKAYVLGGDETNDLVVLKTDTFGHGIAEFRIGARLGEASYAYGFPLRGTLSDSGNFTIGNVTSLSGINDDSRVLQTSAPVQQGNSGGPLLDDKGAVIGVVEKKLDAMMVASKTGDIPQNVNFAIQTAIVVNFLATKNILLRFSKAEKKLDPVDIAERAKEFTVQVTCK